jgi:transposase InsO family protein
MGTARPGVPGHLPLIIGAQEKRLRCWRTSQAARIPARAEPGHRRAFPGNGRGDRRSRRAGCWGKADLRCTGSVTRSRPWHREKERNSVIRRNYRRRKRNTYWRCWTRPGVWYLLYVIMDIYSRKVIHWEIWPTEAGILAREFIEHAIAANGGIVPKSVHADRGTSMTSNTVAGLYAKLNIAQSHSRPHVSNDNPYSESAFKTMKYCPAFPGQFGPSRTPMFSARHSSPTTTPGTGTPASRCTLPHPSTTAPGPRYRAAVPPPSTPPTRRTRNGSGAAARSRRGCQPRYGSTSHPPPSRPAHHHKQRKQLDVSPSFDRLRGRQVQHARFSMSRRRATSDPGIPAGQKPPFVWLRRAVQHGHRRVSLLILKFSLLILNSSVRNNALTWSPVTESNRRPSPYHLGAGRSLKVVGAGYRLIRGR